MAKAHYEKIMAGRSAFVCGLTVTRIAGVLSAKHHRDGDNCFRPIRAIDFAALAAADAAYINGLKVARATYGR